MKLTFPPSISTDGQFEPITIEFQYLDGSGKYSVFADSKSLKDALVQCWDSKAVYFFQEDPPAWQYELCAIYSFLCKWESLEVIRCMKLQFDYGQSLSLLFINLFENGSAYLSPASPIGSFHFPDGLEKIWFSQIVKVERPMDFSYLKQDGSEIARIVTAI